MHKVSSLISLCSLHRLIWDNTLSTCIKPTFPRSRLIYSYDNQYIYPFERWNQILKAFANSLDPDETPQNMASHQDPNCLLF